MMIRLICASMIVLAPAAFAAGLWQGQHANDVPQASTIRVNPPVLNKPGYGAAAAAKYFAVLNAPPPPPRIGPVPPDVGMVFRAQVAAVITDKTPHVVLTDGRSLARGQDYRDGWKIREVSTDAVVLAKGAETRSINLFSTPSPVAANTGGLAGVGGFAPISLTNGQKAGQMSAAALARIMQALRAMGLPQGTLDQLQRALSATTTMNQGEAIQIINQAMRGRQVTQAQLNSLIQAFVAAGAIPAAQAPGLSQALFSQQQTQQLQGIFRGGAGGAPAGGFGGGGPGGGRGGGGRGGRGALGLTAPNVPAASQLGQPAPAPTTAAPPAPALGPAAALDPAPTSSRLAAATAGRNRDEAHAL